MTQRTQLLASVVASAIAIVVPTESATAADAPPGFRIMSDQEADSYRMAMQALDGQAREDYRNAQYEKLRQRALEHGFRMPVTPPWAGQTAAPNDAAAMPATTSPAPTDDAAALAAERHAAMREKLHSGRESLQRAAAADSARLQAEARDTQAAAATPTRTPAAGGGPAAQDAAVDAPPPSPSGQASPPMAAAAPATAPPASAPIFAPVAPPVEPPEAPLASAAEHAPPPPPPAAPVPTAAPEPPTEPVLPTPSVLAVDRAVTTEDPVMGVPPETTASVSAPPAPPAMSDVDAYRESMRSRFDAYLEERQAKRDEALRQQREQREAALEQSRVQMNRGRYQPPFPYPPGPMYGPRYPGAFPGYRTPYWQQPPPPPQPLPEQ